MNTQEAMEIALRMSGFPEVPGDSAVHIPGNFSRPLVAIDVGVSELLLAKELKCDGIIAHHPLGSSYINFYRVLSRHIDFMREFGLSGELGHTVEPLIERSKLRAHVAINSHVVDAARHLGLPLINIHLPCDEIGRRVMNQVIMNAGPNVSDVIEALSSLPEFRDSIRPEVVLGKLDTPKGKTVLLVAAGTNGGYLIAKKYFLGGADTVIYMHIDQEDLRKLREDPELKQKNLVLIGHQPGDSVGINAYLRELQKYGIEPVKIGITGG